MVVVNDGNIVVARYRISTRHQGRYANIVFGKPQAVWCFVYLVFFLIDRKVEGTRMEG